MKRIKKLLIYLLNFPRNLVTFVYLRIRGVECKFGTINLYGIPIIKKHKNSRIIIGKHVTLVSSSKYNIAGVNHPTIIATVSENAVIELKDHSGVSGASLVACKKIILGKYSGLGVNTAVYDTDFHVLDKVKRRFQDNIREANSSPITIGNDVWVSANCVILKGVKIGNGVVVGTNSVVTKDLKHDCLYVGNPVHKIKQINNEK